jgi:hypothetical protein
MTNGTTGMIGDMKSYAPAGQIATAGTAGTNGASGFSDDTNIHIVMPREEYDDLLRMRQFIYDNGLVLQYEIFCDVLNGIAEAERLMNEMIVEDNGDDI